MMYLATAVNDRDAVLIPSVISLFTFGRAYHSELVFSDNNAIVVTPKLIGYAKHTYDWYEWSLVPLPMITPEDELKIRADADGILAGHPTYDYFGAILGQFGKWANSESRWYCSELCRYLLRNHFKDLGERDKFISPTTLWKKVAAQVKACYPNATQNLSIRIA